MSLPNGASGLVWLICASQTFIWDGPLWPFIFPFCSKKWVLRSFVCAPSQLGDQDKTELRAEGQDWTPSTSLIQPSVTPVPGDPLCRHLLASVGTTCS